MLKKEVKSKEELRIIYMGTPEFAVPALEKLVAAGWKVVGVITAPDKPQGRGQKLVGSPVKQAAERLGLHILQPTNLKNPDFQQELRDLKADLQIVVAFRMLPESVWNMPPLGYFQPPCLTPARLSGCRSDQLGDYQWRKRNRCYDLFPQT